MLADADQWRAMGSSVSLGDKMHIELANRISCSDVSAFPRKCEDTSVLARSTDDLKYQLLSELTSGVRARIEVAVLDVSKAA